MGGMTTAAWTPREHGSSICCSMKQDTLLWYWGGWGGGVAELGLAETCSPHPAQPRGQPAGRGVALTACLHQEQLMATISLLWKVNFCWKPWEAEGGEGPWGWAQSSRPSPFLPSTSLCPGQLSTLIFF